MIEPKYAIGDRVVITVADDMFSGQHATIRSWKRRRKPQWRISYVLDIDGKPRKWGAGPYSEDELTKERSVNITQITVSYGETQSLPEYSNVKPSITLTATIEDGDDAATVEADLWTHAKNAVREQIDLALEANGKAAKWSGEPRYQVMETYWSEYEHRGEERPPQYVIILPNQIDLDRYAYAQKLIHAGNSSGDARKLRYDHARRLAAEVLQKREYTLLDCSNGDLTPLEAVLPKRVALAPERPFDSEDARTQEHTSPEYQAAMGITGDDGAYQEIDDEDDA